MTRRLRLAGLQRAGLHLALAAMILRALLPAGWMPSQTAGIHLTICTAETGKQSAPALPGHPLKHGEHQLCPFAAASHLARAGEATPVLLTPQRFAFPQILAPPAARDDLRLKAYASRAPPRLLV